jgi:HPr kinase/phosphorylase
MERGVGVGDLLRLAGKPLGLRRLDTAGADPACQLEADDDAALVGPFNPVRPPCIQVVGTVEQDYLADLGKNSLADALAKLVRTDRIIILADGIEPPKALAEQVAATGTALLASDAPTHTVISNLRHLLARDTARVTTLHGVYLEVLGLGVLLTGSSAVGKSELALELISRGHRLVADDAPRFRRVDPETVNGHCPEALRGFLEVRGLGVLDIPAMFGESALKASKNLRLVVDLQPFDQVSLDAEARLRGARRDQEVLGVTIPGITLPVAPGRNLAVLVEGAVRNHILAQSGYDAADAFMDKQRALMDASSGSGT